MEKIIFDVTLIVPTLNAGEIWRKWLEGYHSLDRKFECLVIDSSSIDDTVDLAKESGLVVRVIERCEFDHGGTRNLALTLSKTNFVIFLTQDAILGSPNAVEKIMSHFNDGKVAAVCGRQLPHRQASKIEAHARLYNYQNKTFVRTINDIEQYGIKTVFISNSFAAYRVSALNEIGGFPEGVIFGEDMYTAAKLLKAGYKIAYAADACVYHSHHYTFSQEMRRYFDMGVFHAREPWIRQEFGGAEREGLKFVTSEFKYLLKNAVWLIPEGFIRTVLRYVGFRVGLLEARLPKKMKILLAMNKGYFK